MSTYIQIRPTYEATGNVFIPFMINTSSVASTLHPRQGQRDAAPTHTCFVKPVCLYTTQGTVQCGNIKAKKMIV